MKITKYTITIWPCFVRNLREDFKSFPKCCRLLIPSFFLFAIPNLQAQCPLSCGSVQLSLDLDCEVEVTWDMLVTGNPAAVCIPDLTVEIFDNGNLIPTSPFVTGDYTNQTLTGKVTHGPTGNSCWSQITVEDKLKPVLTCTDTLVSCFQSTAPATTGFPIVIDNCTDNIVPTFSQGILNFNCTNNDTISIITRIWTAIDSSGNIGNCTQKIYVNRPNLSQIVLPPNLDDEALPALSCDSPNTTPANCGMPHYGGLSVNGVCSFTTDYEDVIAPICENSYAIFRTWEVYDACVGQTITHEQVINILDNEPPGLVCPPNMIVNTSNLDCTATVILPQPATSDSCSSSVAISVEGSFGTVTGTTIYNLARGTYPTTCIATDNCGNSANCVFQIVVKDNVPPVAVSVPQANIALLPSQPTPVNAATFDGGSSDNCSTLTREVRRLDSPHCPGDDSTPFGPTVPFYCCDAGHTVSIVLKVTDVEGNSSTVTSQAVVMDNLNPGILCPDNVTLGCGSDYEDMALTGEPTAADNCTGFEVTFEDVVSLNSCGIGTVLRTFTVEDHVGRTASCTQTISIQNSDPFYVNPLNPNDPNDDIVWPQNYTADSCGIGGLLPAALPPGFDFPQITFDSTCDHIAVNYTDTWFSQPQNACIEILRSWLVVDWCQYNQATGAGSWQYGQIIRITNSQAPEFTSTCEEQFFCSYDADCAMGNATLSAQATDDCTPAIGLVYTYKIDIFDNGSVDQTGSGHVVQSNFPIGTHRITFTVEDLCHNKTSCSWLFTIRDCKKPTPYCHNLIVEIMDGTPPVIEVAAESLNAGSYDNCTAAGDLMFAFSADTSALMRSFDCLNIGTNQVQIWVTDEEGNQDYCIANIEVQGNNNVCLSHATITGTLRTEDSSGVALAMVAINDPALLDSMATGTDGAFDFQSLAIGGDYSIVPNKNINPLNGVTTFDLVLITKHILGNVQFDSPYKIIAADVNKSGAVTTSDLVALRRMILFIDLQFVNNKSWRFVDAEYQFTNPVNPFLDNFPEVVSFNNLPGDASARFVAIKIGDVNGSADTEE